MIVKNYNKNKHNYIYILSLQKEIKKMLNRKKLTQNTMVLKRTSQLNTQSKFHKENKHDKYSEQTKIIALSQKNIEKNNIKFPSVRNSKLINQSNYILNQILGEGAFAKVRLAYRKSDGLPCVIKSYQKFRITSSQKKKAIFKEIQILKNTQHPNIIKILDFYQNSDTINIVMQHFSNQSLASFVHQNRPLQQQKLRKITKSIAQALSYLHKNKIAHRDIKPQNVLINSQNQIKIIDLGLSTMGDHEQMIVAGTPQFMCPQLINKKNYNPFKADIWAFGILLYWMVLGYYPQDNNKKTSKLSKTNKFQLKFPVDMHPGIQYLIQKMLQNDPQLRVDAENILEDSWIKPRNIKFQISKLQKFIKT